MTSINYINDIHLDFYVKYTTNPEKLKCRMDEFTDSLFKNKKLGDVLIIAGDFGHMNSVSQLFLESVAPRYKHVFATYGNHDMYLISSNSRKKYRTSYARVYELIENTSHIDNLTWLSNGSVHTYNGLKIAGHPMPACPKHPEEESFYREMMNDFKYIKYRYDYQLPDFHHDGLKAYESMPDDLDIFVSHYPLVRTPVFINDASQGSYYNFVDELKAKHYFFGHVHQRDSFEKAGANFHTYAIGYPEEGFDYSLGYIEI